jgi:hypothetical protein
MRLSKAILEPADLPKTGARESPTLEFKGNAAFFKDGKTPDTFETAKDIGAMASAYGGTIIVGAHGRERLATYKGFDGQEAERIAKMFEQAAQQRCSPPVPVNVAIISHEGSFIVAVNVEAVLTQPIGVKAPTDASKGWGGDAWVFHTRLSTHANEINPKDLPMYMNPKIRRIALLLEGVPEASRANVWLWWNTVVPVTSVTRRERPENAHVTLNSVSIVENSVSFSPEGKDQGQLRIPLEDVRAVWQSEGEAGALGAAWSVRVTGAVDLTSRTYQPRTWGESDSQ